LWKRRSGIGWLLAGVRRLKRIRRNTDKGRCGLCLGEEDVKRILLDCLETRNWRIKFFNEKCLNMKKEIAYRKILRCANKGQMRHLGSLEKLKYKTKQSKCEYVRHVPNGDRLPP
jgi:hypothetical protein